MKRNNLENVVTTGTLDGERVSGRLDSLAAWHNRDENYDYMT